MSQKNFVARVRRRKPSVISLMEGDTVTLGFDVGVLEDTLGSTVSTATWSTEESSTVGIAGENLASQLATADITAINEGCALVTVQLDTADGQTVNEKLNVIVKDPDPLCYDRVDHDYYRWR